MHARGLVIRQINEKGDDLILKKWSFKHNVILAVSLLFLVAYCGESRAFDCKVFPDLIGEHPAVTVSHEQYNLCWQVYDLDDDRKADCALGYLGLETEKSMVITPYGPTLYEWADTEGIIADYYWLDIDGNGNPFTDEGVYNLEEVIKDKNKNGLDELDEPAYDLAPKTGT